MTGQTGDSELPGAVRLTMRPESDFYGPSDDRLEAEMFELQTAISQEFPDALKAKPVPGAKGPALDLVMTLVSSGALTALSGVLKTWLSRRPQNRTVNLEFEITNSDGTTRKGTLNLDATNVEPEVLGKITEQTFKRRDLAAVDARALVICNWEYTDSTGTLSPLNGPANDLRQIVDAFEDEQFGLFQGQVTTCENLTNEKLRTEVYEFLESAKPNDTLLLYYSGHGERRVDGRLALCGVDTEFPKLNATSFDTNNLREWLEQFNRAPSTMVILDCCYAGQFLKGGVTEEVLASSLGTGTVVIASGGNQPSKDSMSDDACSPFTAALAKILLDPDVPGDVDGFLTADELYSRLMDSAPPLQPMPKRNVQGQGRFPVALRERPAEAKRPDLKGFRTIDVEEIELTFGGDQVSAVLGSGDTDALDLDALDEHRQAAVRRISQLADAVLRVAENDEDEWAQRVVRRAWNCVGTNLFETALPPGVRDAHPVDRGRRGGPCPQAATRLRGRRRPSSRPSPGSTSTATRIRAVVLTPGRNRCRWRSRPGSSSSKLFARRRGRRRRTPPLPTSTFHLASCARQRWGSSALCVVSMDVRRLGSPMG